MSHTPQIALTWSAHRAWLVVARSQAGRMIVEHARSVESTLESDNEPETISCHAPAIAQMLEELGITKGEVVVVVPRNQVEMRQLECPLVPDDELSDLIKFQAATQFSSFEENDGFDYIPMEPGETSRAVLAARLASSSVDEIKRTIEQAGLKLRKIVVRPFALANLLQQDYSDRCVLAIESGARETNLSVIDHGIVRFTRAVRAPDPSQGDAYANWLPGEVLRTLSASQNQAETAKVSQILLLDVPNDSSSLQDRLADKVSADIDCIDPFEFIAHKEFTEKDHTRPEFTALLGAISALANPCEFSMDFLHPRGSQNPTDYRRAMFVGGGVLLACVILFVATSWLMLSSRESTNQALIAERDQLLKSQPQRLELIAQMDVFDRWKRQDIDWLEVLYQISDRLPSPDHAILQSFDGNVMQKHAALSFRGKILDENTISMMNRNMPESYDANTTSTVPTQSGDMKFNFANGGQIPLRDISQIGNERLQTVETNVETVTDSTFANTQEATESNE